MKIFIDNVVDAHFEFDYVSVAELVCNTVLDIENCPFECEVNITITDNDEIHEINRETRGIDKETDVLSFPCLEYSAPSDFTISDSELASYIDPETEMIVLGDIVLSFDRIVEQAKDFGHSVLREYAFLIVHSMLHLCGYDHMTEQDAVLMEKKQEDIMNTVGIRRE